MKVLGAAPSAPTAPDAVAVYFRDVSGDPTPFFKTSDGTEHSFGDGGGGISEQDYYARAILTGPQDTGEDVIANWYRLKIDAAQELDLVGAYATAKQVPTWADFIADILVSRNGGSTWASLFNAGNANKLKIALGDHEGQQETFAIGASPLLTDDLLRVDLLSVGGAVGTELVLKGKVL
jgi:hypothetical protein